MFKYVPLFFVFLNWISNTQGLWNEDVNCPLICNCHLEHLTETAIYRFMQKNKEKPIPGELGIVENNDVLNEESMDTVELLEEHGSTITRSAICILQTETDPTTLIESLPKNIESLTLIQGYASGNKTVKMSHLQNFPHLTTVEFLGPNLQTQPLLSYLICELDIFLPDLKYLNLERVLIKNSKQQMINLLKEASKENITFEFPLKFDNTSHVVTLIHNSANDEAVVPYDVFKKESQSNLEIPIFMGFKKLLLLRISDCNINNINWEMFDGLHDLQYLILEKNNIKFVPPFAFYGTPNLRTLSLAHNNLLDIQLTDLAGLLQLEYVDFSFNSFTQLSELSFPPFPNLKLANFANNPISVIFPNTFEVMNKTNSLIIGSQQIPLKLVANSLFGLDELKKLTLNNLQMEILKRDLFTGMPKLMELILNGNITRIEYDAFLEIKQIDVLIMSNCQIVNISMDSFIGLNKLQYLDLSKNLLEYVPPGSFDHLTNIKELYLNGNRFKQLPRDIFSKIFPKLLRLNDNPWHCSCDMSDWKPMIVNKIKHRTVKPCDYSNDKGISCTKENRFINKYVYENKIAPKCSEPEQFLNWNVFHAMRRILRCADYKPKLKKRYKNVTEVYIKTTELTSTPVPFNKLSKLEKLKYKLKKHKQLFVNQKNITTKKPSEENENNHINYNQININSVESNQINDSIEPIKKLEHRRMKKRFRKLKLKNIDMSNDIQSVL